jgi:hypothetical protein
LRELTERRGAVQKQPKQELGNFNLAPSKGKGIAALCGCFHPLTPSKKHQTDKLNINPYVDFLFLCLECDPGIRKDLNY